MAILKPIALLAKPVGDGHAHVLEHHSAGRLGVPAHLAFVGAERDAGVSPGTMNVEIPAGPAPPVRAITT